MASNHILFRNGKPAPTVAILGFFVALSNYELSQLCQEYAERLEDLGWVLQQGARLTFAAHWDVLTPWLSHVSAVLPFVLHVALCLWRGLVCWLVV
jgi:hypothetical protein